MTREELLDLICPTDNANDCCRGEANFNCNTCEKTLVEWLDDYAKLIRADAIDEFDKALRTNTLMPNWCYQLVSSVKKDLLKEQTE